MNCSICGKAAETAELIFSRGYLWHRPCAKVYRYFDTDKEYVDFPSDGKMIPASILYEREDA